MIKRKKKKETDPAGSRHKAGPAVREAVLRYVKSPGSRIMVLAGCLCAAMMVLVPLKSSAADDSLGRTSLYKISSAAAAYFDTGMTGNLNDKKKEGDVETIELKKGWAEDSEELAVDENHVKAGLAGGYIGYIDKDFVTGDTFKAWTVSADSAAQQSRALDVYYNAIQVNKGKSDVQSVATRKAAEAALAYTCYGILNTKLGLDTVTQPGYGSANSWFGRVMKVVYTANTFSDIAFGVAINVLRMLNPFPMLVTGANGGNGSTSALVSQLQGADADIRNALTGDDLANYQNFTDKYGVSGFDQNKTGALFEIGNQIRQAYEALFNLSWQLAAPLSCFAFMLMLLFFRGQKGPKVRNFVTKILYLAIGVPLIGGLYTSALNSASMDINSGATYSNRIIGSTFCDFENWAKKSRLAVPGKAGEQKIEMSVTVKGDEAIINDNAFVNARLMALRINRDCSTDALKAALDADYGNTNSFIVDGTSESLNTFIGQDGTDLLSDYKNGQKLGGIINTVQDLGNVYSIFSGILDRYSQNDYYLASTYETYVKGKVSAKEYEENKYEDWTKSAADPKNYADKPQLKAPESEDPNVTWFRDGDLVAKVDISNSNQIVVSFDTASSPDTGTGSKAGLSTMGMYNYLNSDFTEKGISVYSSERSTNAGLKASHHSVSLVGGMMIGSLYYLNALCVIAGGVILSFGFAWNLIRCSFEYMLQTIKNISVAALGSLTAMLRVVSAVLGMIFRTYAIIFAYKLFSDMMFMFITGIEDPIIELAKQFMKTNESASIGMGTAILTEGSAVCLAQVLITILTVGSIMLLVKKRESILSRCRVWVSLA